MKSLFHLIHFCWLCTASANSASDWIDAIRESQALMALAKPQQADAVLDRIEEADPSIKRNPHFCYQRFFVALNGRSDRATARLMLQRLDALVAEGTLDPSSNIYRSVTEAWSRTLLLSDLELKAINRSRMAQLRANIEP